MNWNIRRNIYIKNIWFRLRTNMLIATLTQFSVSDVIWTKNRLEKLFIIFHKIQILANNFFLVWCCFYGNTRIHHAVGFSSIHAKLTKCSRHLYNEFINEWNKIKKFKNCLLKFAYYKFLLHILTHYHTNQQNR